MPGAPGLPASSEADTNLQPWPRAAPQQPQPVNSLYSASSHATSDLTTNDSGNYDFDLALFDTYLPDWQCFPLPGLDGMTDSTISAPVQELSGGHDFFPALVDVSCYSGSDQSALEPTPSHSIGETIPRTDFSPSVYSTSTNARTFNHADLSSNSSNLSNPSPSYPTLNKLSSSRPTKRKRVSIDPPTNPTPPAPTTTAPTPPSSTDPTNDMDDEGATEGLTRRKRNTEAARRYRQRKLDRVYELEDALAAMTRERDELRLKLAKVEVEADVLRGLVKGR